MKTATLDQTEIIEALDWEPACESCNCMVGNPAATHIAFYDLDLLRRYCDCFKSSVLLCLDCVERITGSTRPGKRCWCNANVFFHYIWEFARFEPLP